VIIHPMDRANAGTTLALPTIVTMHALTSTARTVFATSAVWIILVTNWAYALIRMLGVAISTVITSCSTSITLHAETLQAEHEADHQDAYLLMTEAQWNHL